MIAKPTMPLVFLLALACGHAEKPAQTARASSAALGSEPEQAPARELEAEGTPAATLSEADLLYDSQLGATRGGQFAVDRQVAELRRAVLLYTQFIERAGTEPDFAAAVKKSRERIVDANQTIEFLLASGSSSRDEPRPARTP